MSVRKRSILQLFIVSLPSEHCFLLVLSRPCLREMEAYALDIGLHTLSFFPNSEQQGKPEQSAWEQNAYMVYTHKKEQGRRSFSDPWW
ncbi:hypothetical protein KSC_026380 [Ktedonobacter sp. SOSP1-52]|nr:hypothetical protein KSC_026380 [Ktedonobacter sp. SOSP1-52]